LANNKSAKKRNKTNEKDRLRNRAAKSAVKTAIKAFHGAVKSKESEVSEEKFRLMVKAIDTAAGKGILHKNMAARKKSRMSKLLSALKA